MTSSSYTSHAQKKKVIFGSKYIQIIRYIMNQWIKNSISIKLRRRQDLSPSFFHLLTTLLTPIDFFHSVKLLNLFKLSITYLSVKQVKNKYHSMPMRTN